MTDISQRLATVALRAVLAEVDRDPELAGEVLGRVLGGSLPASLPPPEPDPPPRARLRAKKIEEPPAPRRRARKPRRAAPAGGPSEGVRLCAELVEKHGGVNAAARAVGSSPALFRRWRAGAPIKPASIERLRAALEGVDQDEEQAPPAAETEAAGLLAQLVARHGSLELVSDRLGLTLSALERVAAGAAVGPTTTQRLRAGLAHPTPEERAAGEEGAEVAPAPPVSFRRAAGA